MDYSASFTASGILLQEFEAIAPFIQKNEVNDFIFKEIRENKYLKITTESGRKRIATELKKRIYTVDDDFWKYFVSCEQEERRLLLFYLCIKTYRLIWDFHFKIAIPDYWAYKIEFDTTAYKMYMDELETKEIAVSKWSDTTRKKCITNYARILRESGLVKNNKIQKPDVANSFYCYFIKQNEIWALDIYLLDNQQKETIRNLCK